MDVIIPSFLPSLLQGDLRGLAAAHFLRQEPGDGSWAWTQVLAACQQFTCTSTHAHFKSWRVQRMHMALDGRWFLVVMALDSTGAKTAAGGHVNEVRPPLIAICNEGWYYRLASSLAQALAREVAYELIPFSQRRRLHAALAEAQEATVKRGDAGPAIPTAANIAYNWTCACATVEVTEWRYALSVSGTRGLIAACASPELLSQLMHLRATTLYTCNSIRKNVSRAPSWRRCRCWAA